MIPNVRASHLVILANGAQLDTSTREYSANPYVKGAELALERWRDFMRGVAMDAYRSIPRYMTNGMAACEVQVMRAGFEDNFENEDLIEAAK